MGSCSGLLLIAILLPRLLCFFRSASVALKKRNEVQVCGNDNRDKLEFALSNTDKRSICEHEYFIVTDFSHIAVDEKHWPGP